MPDYWGVKRIGQRMGVNEATIRTWHRTRGFLMYVRRRPRLKASWFTNDQLIHTWELSQCRLHATQDAERRAALKNRASA